MSLSDYAYFPMTESEDNNSMDADSNDSKDSLQQNPTYLLFIDIYFTTSKLLFVSFGKMIRFLQ